MLKFWEYIKDSFKKSAPLQLIGISILWQPINFFLFGKIKGWDAMCNELTRYLIFAIIPFGIWFFYFLYHLVRSPLTFNRHMSVKIDDDDLKHLLSGFIYKNTFTYNYPVQIFDFSGKNEIEKLKYKYTNFSVHAPKNSLVTIKFSFLNSRLNSQNKCEFWFINEEGKEQLINNIYEGQIILLDVKSSFSLKLSYDQNYIIDDNASLQIFINSWTK